MYMLSSVCVFFFQERTPYLEGHIRWGDGFLIVYSINDRRSYEEATLLKQHVEELRRPSSVPCVIVGNKRDLEHRRTVTRKDGEKLVTEGACAFFETSARDSGTEVVECFHELYREVKRRKSLDGKPRRRSSASQVKQVLNKMFTKIQTG